MNAGAPPIEGSITHAFTAEAAAQCAAEIAEAAGVEVFFVGRRNEAGLVAEIESHAYGSSGAVPVIMDLAKPGDVIIHNHPSGNLTPSDADIGVSSQMGNMGVGSYIIDNAATRCRVVVRPHDPVKKTPLAEAEVLRRLRPEGELSRFVEAYEDRPQQRDMAAAIVRAFNQDGIAVVEAGTGTGKSFAYLVPAALYALRNNERVVISTNTINLQEQILQKDIPAIRSALGEEFAVEIVKGRSNYVCKRKAQYAREEGTALLEDDFARELRQVLDWAASSTLGDRAELNVPPRQEVWERVSSEADNCLRIKCSFYEECFFYNSRRRAARAKLLIVNHSLLMSDLAVRRESGNYTAAAVLPPYSRVILDEAHHLEDVATRNLARMITRAAFRQALGRLYRGDRSGSHGVLVSMQQALGTLIDERKLPPDDPRMARLSGEAMPAVGELREALDFNLNDFAAFFKNVAGIRDVRPHEEHRIRIHGDVRNHDLWREECVRALQVMAHDLGKFIELNNGLLAAYDDLDEECIAAVQNPLVEWKAHIARLEGSRRTILQFIDDDADYCRWVELAARRDRSGELIVRVCLAPIDVREVIRESLHDRMKSEVLTSATLTVDRSFDHFFERTGVPRIAPPKRQKQYDEDGLEVFEREPAAARTVETRLLSSPFDFRTQVFFGVPSDIADPRDTAFDDQLADLCVNAISISGGRAFVLFTSYGQLNRVWQQTRGAIERQGIAVLKQGDESRDALLRRFREDETSVLFATASFWEGVDVRGRALELLIIAKLPFAVPTEPIAEAQFEAVKAQGRDPFENLVVPRAVIRFKQGFGRLIRSRTDRGAVIIADRRVVQMRYGRRFLHSLPELDVRTKRTPDLMADMREFFRATAPGGAA